MKRSKRRTPEIIHNSPMRSLDPRTRLTLALCASLLVMLPLEKLLIGMACYFLLLLWSRLIPPALHQIWRIRWVLILLFVLDTLVIGLDLAVIVTLRLILLAGVFSLFFSTTTMAEFSLALEKMHVSYRMAFSIGLAFQSLNLFDEELRTIREAQQARGLLTDTRGIRALFSQGKEWVALTVPAVVLATRRAWAITEAAYGRGFDSPHRRPFLELKMKVIDGSVILLTLVFIILINIL